MQLTTWDWVVIGLFFVLNQALGLRWARRPPQGQRQAYGNGQTATRWLAASRRSVQPFGLDMPLLVTGLVYTQGIGGNWLWWPFAFRSMFTLFFLAPLRRRSGFLTEPALCAARYSGTSAEFLQGFRAVYVAVLVRTLVLGWVNLAMVKLLRLTLGLGKLQAVTVCLVATLVYASASGLGTWLWTDGVGVVLQAGMALLLAYVAVGRMGGMDNLIARVRDLDAVRGTHTLQFFPHTGQSLLLSFLVLLSVNWWAGWYAGMEPGDEDVTSRCVDRSRGETHSVGAALWFQLAHYAVQPWPWILTALVGFVLLPALSNAEGSYLQVLLRLLPQGLRGLMVAGFVMAYLSTTARDLNRSARSLVDDVYRRILVRAREPGTDANATRLARLLCAVLIGVATLYLHSIANAWRLLIALGAGAGLVTILRWFWWRVNAWSEIAAMTAAAAISLTLQSRAGGAVAHALHRLNGHVPNEPLHVSDPHSFAWLLLLTTGGTTLVWLAVTWLTPPESQVALQTFYDRVRPPAAGWKPFAPESARAEKRLRWNAMHFVLGSALVLFALFGIGNLLFQRVADGLLMLVCSMTCLTLLVRSLNRRTSEQFG